TYAFSQRRACRVLGAHRRTMRYRRRIRADEDALRTRLRSLACPRRGSTAAGETPGCISCSKPQGGETITSAPIAPLGRRGWRCGGANANASPCHRVAQSSRPGSAEKPGVWTSCKMCSLMVDGSGPWNILDLATRECLALEVDTS